MDELGDLAQQPAAVGAANGVEHLAQLPAPKVGLVGLVATGARRAGAAGPSPSARRAPAAPPPYLPRTRFCGT